MRSRARHRAPRAHAATSTTRREARASRLTYFTRRRARRDAARSFRERRQVRRGSALWRQRTVAAHLRLERATNAWVSGRGPALGRLAPVGMATHRGTALRQRVGSSSNSPVACPRACPRWASCCRASHAEPPCRPPLVAPSWRPALRDISTSRVVEASAPHVRHRYSRLREMPRPPAGRRIDCGRARRPPHPRAPRASVGGAASRARPRSNRPRRRGARVRIAGGVRADARRRARPPYDSVTTVGGSSATAIRIWGATSTVRPLGFIADRAYHVLLPMMQQVELK
ncbi:MAG: hypothetical protein JWP87_133 [Labilithrix sp.]|nr:hypothetical protein [Labilithrix sp.]